MGVRVIWVDQPTRMPQAWSGLVADKRGADGDPAASAALQGLSCAGYGSAVTVTAAMGLAAAGEAIEMILKQSRQAVLSLVSKHS